MFEEKQNDIINDVYSLEEWESSMHIDTRPFFHAFKIRAIYLNKEKIFTDIFSWLDSVLNVKKRLKLKIKALHDDQLIDIKERINVSFFKWILMSKNKFHFHTDPINLSSCLCDIAKNSIDIRYLEPIISTKTYPDIYNLPLSIKEKWKKYFSKNKKIIIKSWSLWVKVSLISTLIGISLVIFLIWLKNYIQTEVITQYQKIYSLKDIKDPTILQSETIKIRNSFNFISIIFAPINFFWNNIFYSNPSVYLANNVIKWWLMIWEAGVIITNIYWDLEKETQKSLPLNKEKLTWLAKYKNLKITNFLKQEQPSIEKINNYIKKAILYYSRIDSLNEPALDTKFQSILKILWKWQSYLDFFLLNNQVIYNILWDTSPQRYLILNQNQDEIRANWWFPWSVVTVELYKGNIINYDKKDVYYYDWHLYPYKEKPPEWLNIISPNHGLRDANYSEEFLKSAEKINFFYEKAWGWSLNTVIWINQSLVKDFLKKYWSIHMDEINMDITPDNFSIIMSTLVENKFNATISPKDILFSFSEKLEKHLLDKKDFVGYLDIILDNLKKWEIVIASRDSEIQKFFDSFNIFETWKQDNGNWVYPIFTSISWNKSDRYMTRNFEINSTKSVWTWCILNNNFIITSTHTFWIPQRDEIREILKYLRITNWKEKDRLMRIEWGWENRQYVRLLVPAWSKLTNTYNKNIKEDNSNPNYIIFNFYLNTDVGKTTKIKFDYISSPKNCVAQTNFYKQSGLTNYTFNQKN